MQAAGADAPHVPVLLREVTAAIAPLVDATVVDGTFGAGGYSRAFLAAGAGRVLGIDRDPTALAAADWAVVEPRLMLAEGQFGELDEIAADRLDSPVDAVVLDIGVSSMQLDQAQRGFSFLRDGPLDMRMGADGPDAADLVNDAAEAELADILYWYGEEKAARRVARAIVAARAEAPITTTGALASLVENVLPQGRKQKTHPATRTFQALRIAVNGELDELASALNAAERLLGPGGRLAVVTFHSLEDRMVKRFFQITSGRAGGGSRHAPEVSGPRPSFERPRKDVSPAADELEVNPRARSARLRSAVRTDAPPIAPSPAEIGAPPLTGGRL